MQTDAPKTPLRDIPFNERGVMLSRAGLSAAGQMIPLKDLRTADVLMVPRSKPLPVVITLIGLLTLAGGIAMGSGPALVLGVMIAVVGYLSWITQDVTYRLMVGTPEGVREMFMTKDEAFAERVAVLVRDAIAGLKPPAAV
jgi:Family of unknown function (DUF6232)